MNTLNNDTKLAQNTEEETKEEKKPADEEPENKKEPEPNSEMQALRDRIEALEKDKAANEKAPLELTFVEPENGVLQITWNKVAGAHRYFVMKKDADGNWKEKIHVTDPGYIDYSPVPGDPNTYTVIAVDIDGKEISGYGKG